MGVGEEVSLIPGWGWDTEEPIVNGAVVSAPAKENVTVVGKRPLFTRVTGEQCASEREAL